MKRISTLFFVWLGFFSSYAQEMQTVESLAFGDYLSPLVKVKKDGRNYFYHLDGKVWIDKVENHVADFFVVINDGYYGVLKEDGTLVVPFSYDGVKVEAEYQGTWYEGINYDYKFIVLKKEGRVGVANDNGHIIVPLEHEEAKALNKNSIGIRQGNRWGWASPKDGKVVHEPVFDHIGNFFSDQFLVVEKGGLEGVYQVDGQLIVPLKYAYVRYLQTAKDVYFYGVRDKKVEVYDVNGQLLLSDMEEVGTLAGSPLLSFRENGLYGLIDPSAKKVIVRPSFEKVENYVRGLSIAKKGGKFGVIGLNGATLLEFTQDEITFVNAKGDVKYGSFPMLSVPSVESSNPVLEETRLRKQYEDSIDKAPYFIKTVLGTSEGIYSWEGKVIVPIGKYTSVKPHYYNGEVYFQVVEGGRFGLLDIRGNELLSAHYSVIRTYQYGTREVRSRFHLLDRFIAVSSGKDEKTENEKIGLYDVELKKMVIEPAAQYLDFLDERFIKIRQMLPDYKNEFRLYDISTGKVLVLPGDVKDFHMVSGSYLLIAGERVYRLIDLEGYLVYENKNWQTTGSYHLIRFPKYAKLQNGDFYHGLKKIYGVEGNLFIDETGKEKRFEGVDQVDDFYEGIALAGKKVSDSESFSGFKCRFGIIDTAGKEIAPFLYDEVSTIGEEQELLLVRSGEREGVVTRHGRAIFEPVYESISYASNGLFTLRQHGLYGLADRRGNILIEPTYETLDYNYRGEDKTWPLLVKEKDWYFFVNKKGERYPLQAREKHY